MPIPVNLAGHLRNAISRGAPLFNNGNHRACADEYRATATALLSGVPDGVATTLRVALERARSQNDTEAAWTLRRAFDSILESRAATADVAAVAPGPPDETKKRPASPAFPLALNAMTMGLVRWAIVNDTVMGGRSSSAARVSEAGELVFTGEVTRAGGGGFASVRGTPPAPLCWAGAEGIDLKVLGDGQRYKVQLRTDGGFDGVAYQADFLTDDGAWREVRLPFASFVPSFRGRTVADAPPLNGARVQQVGFMLSFLTDAGAPNRDFAPGPFALRVRSVTAYAPGRRPASFTRLGG